MRGDVVETLGVVVASVGVVVGPMVDVVVSAGAVVVVEIGSTLNVVVAGGVVVTGPVVLVAGPRVVEAVAVPVVTSTRGVVDGVGDEGSELGLVWAGVVGLAVIWDVVVLLGAPVVEATYVVPALASLDVVTTWDVLVVGTPVTDDVVSSSFGVVVVPTTPVVVGLVASCVLVLVSTTAVELSSSGVTGRDVVSADVTADVTPGDDVVDWTAPVGDVSGAVDVDAVVASVVCPV